MPCLVLSEGVIAAQVRCHGESIIRAIRDEVVRNCHADAGPSAGLVWRNQLTPVVGGVGGHVREGEALRE